MVPRLDARRAHAHDADILLHDEATEPESPVATEIDHDLMLQEHALQPSSTFSIILNGLLDALGLSTRWVVAGSVAAALLLNRDADTLAFVSGAIANGGLSKVLKVSTTVCRFQLVEAPLLSYATKQPVHSRVFACSTSAMSTCLEHQRCSLKHFLQ
jgi:hypothetical protein